MTDPAGQSGAACEPRPQAGCSQHIDDRQFARWTQLLEWRAGLFIAPERKSFLASGLRARMRETGCDDLGEYYQLLSQPARQAREWLRLVEEVVLPASPANGTVFNAWSVACSTGEEAYSLAMLIDRYCAGSGKRFGVTGTDISIQSLRTARAGTYMDRRLKDIPEELRERYCSQVKQHRFEVKSKLRERVCFAQLNLRDVASAPMADMDLVFCQNLLIYYDRKRRLEIVNSLSDRLRPGGVLVLGPGELLNWQHPHMEKVRYQDTLAYRRTD